MGFKFFLYGVYDEGQKCYSRFENLVVSKVRAHTLGTFHRLSCGLTILHPQGEMLIPGTLVELNIEDTHLPYLDAVNGYDASSPKKSFLLRKTIDVRGEGEAAISAQAYCLNEERKSTARPIEQASELSTDILLNKLTDRQQLYIRKLSQAKGREIVPVDMALYRELMSLELIVDKGRRLALTTLGQEISAFL